MVKTRSIAIKPEVTNSIPVVKTEMSSNKIPASSPTRFIMPKRRNGSNSKPTAVVIEVPNNSQVNMNPTSNKRIADPVITTSPASKRCKAIRPKIECIPTASILQATPVKNQRSVLHTVPTTTTRKKRVVNIAPMPTKSLQPTVNKSPLLMSNVKPAVTRKRLLAPASALAANVPLAQTINVPVRTALVPIAPRIKSETVNAKPNSKAAGKARANVISSTAESSTSRVKKETVVKKLPAVKKERKPRVKKPKFQLPPEANAYMSDAMRGRVLRAMKQSMYVISRELEEGDDSCERFEVIGSVGNGYTVSIGTRIKCSCMDYAIRKLHCKHILMILFKVYRLPCSHSMFRSLTTNRDQRLEARSQGRVVDPSVLVPTEIRQKIMSIAFKNHPGAASSEEEQTAQRRPLDTSDCPICFEEFEESLIADIDFCKVCGNNVHKDCFNMWAKSKGREVTCVYCRTKWVVSNPSNGNAGPSKNRVGDLDEEHIHESYYANFAKELGIKRTRDTSTYKSNYRYNFDC